MAFTNYAETMMMEHTLHFADRGPGGTNDRPAAVYLAFCSSDPGEGATTLAGAEIATSGDPTRVEIRFDAPEAETGPPLGRKCLGPTATQGELNVTTTGWTDTSDISHVAISDALTFNTGNALYHGALAAPITFSAGDTIRIAVRSIDCRLVDNTAANHMAASKADLWLNHLLRASEAGAAFPYPSANPVCSLHNADPGDTGTPEFGAGAGGYARQTFTPRAAVDAGGFETIRNNGLIQFTNIDNTVNSDSVRYWGMWVNIGSGEEFIYSFNQTDRAVANGSDVDGADNTIAVGAN